MARVDNSIQARDVLGLSQEFKKAVESVEWSLADINLDFEWKDGVKTDTVKGVTWLMVGPRTGNKLIRNKELKITSDELITQDKIDKLKNDENGILINLTDLHLSSLYTRTEKGSTYASIEYKLGATMTLIKPKD